MTRDFAIAQLRHLYALMIDGKVRDSAEAARGLLGPAIEALETTIDVGGGREFSVRERCPECYSTSEHAFTCSRAKENRP